MPEVGSVRFIYFVNGSGEQSGASRCSCAKMARKVDGGV